MPVTPLYDQIQQFWLFLQTSSSSILVFIPADWSRLGLKSGRKWTMIGAHWATSYHQQVLQH